VARYELTASADEDLVDIYTYSFIRFGEAQADAYFESLERCLNRLAENPQLGRDVSFIRKGYRRFIHRRHSIYFTAVRQGISISRILGPGKEINRDLS
jgi:toxin ParE1/3/4